MNRADILKVATVLILVEVIEEEKNPWKNPKVGIFSSTVSFSFCIIYFARESNSSSEDSLLLLSSVVSFFSGSGEAGKDIFITDITNIIDHRAK